jgi:uncharacterized protein YuzE
MKIRYSREADILMIELRDGSPSDSIDLKEGVILHLDEKGLPLEIEILDASKIAMLKEISVMTPIEVAGVK